MYLREPDIWLQMVMNLKELKRFLYRIAEYSFHFHFYLVALRKLSYFAGYQAHNHNTKKVQI